MSDDIYKEYWENKYYVLVKNDNPLGYTIHDVEMGLMVIFEDSAKDIVPKIISKMLENGTQIYNSIKELPASTLPRVWSSMNEYIEFIEVTKELNLTEEEVKTASRYVIGKKLNKEDLRKVIKSIK